jgi:hypothetical protein
LLARLFAFAPALCAPANCGTGMTDGPGLGLGVGTPPRLDRLRLDMDRLNIDMDRLVDRLNMDMDMDRLNMDMDRLNIVRLVDRLDRLRLDLDPPVTILPDCPNTSALCAALR